MTTLPETPPVFQTIIQTESAYVADWIERTILAYDDGTMPWGDHWFDPPSVWRWPKHPGGLVVSIGGPAHIFRPDGSGVAVPSDNSMIEFWMWPHRPGWCEIRTGVCADRVVDGQIRGQDPAVVAVAVPLWEALISGLTHRWSPDSVAVAVKPHEKPARDAKLNERNRRIYKLDKQGEGDLTHKEVAALITKETGKKIGPESVRKIVSGLKKANV
jgi:hypothetical protein